MTLWALRIPWFDFNYQETKNTFLRIKYIPEEV